MMRLDFGLCLLAIGAIAVLGTSVASAQQSTDTAPVKQVLSISTTPRLDPAPTEQDYLDAFKLTHDAGVDGNAFTAKWSELEGSGGKYLFDNFLNGMAGYEYAYPDTLMFGIQVLNTTTKETPPDLMNVSFDDPQMLTRFNALIDAMLPKFKPYVRYLSIGNEVDVYLANHPQEWATYKKFYDGVVDHVHQVDPDVQVGVTVTYSGALAHTNEVMTLNQHSDVFFLTYYPLETDFTANHPDAPLKDFPNMVKLANGLPVILQEVGYPSAELLHSSDADQVTFVKDVFTAWKSAGNAIPFLNYFLLHDLTEDICNQLEGYYGIKDANFHAYLCTLGLRQANGTPKESWQTFVDEAAAWRKSIG